MMSKIYTAVVVEYFKRPVISEDEAQAIIDKYDNFSLSLTSYQQLFSMPRGSFIGKFVDTPEISDLCIFYPFFSHMKSPIKAGEQVFVIWNGKAGYWLSRKVADLVAEDSNFTHNDRAVYSVSTVSNDMTGDASSNPAKRFPDFLNAGISYDIIYNNSDSAATEFQGEPVPRYAPISPDFSLQGSNNSLIVLGSSATLGSKSTSTGMIDIVAGRGQGSETGGSETYLNDRSYEEIDKSFYGNPNEGDLDLAGDLSRIHLSMGMNPDSSFGIKIGEDLGSGPSIIAKSNKIRINAREDIKIDNGSVGLVIDESTITATTSTGVNATEVIIDSQQSLQSNLASSLSEIYTGFQALGIPLPNTLNLITLLQSKSFSSKIIKSE